jgi:hypothetical protein
VPVVLYYQPTKGIAMGSPISSTMAEIYLQLLEDTYLKHSPENREILYYKRYVDDIFIICDQKKTNADTIHKTINNLDHNLQFSTEIEENNITCYLDLAIQKKTTE